MSISAGGIVIRKEGEKYFIALEQNALMPDTGKWFIPKGHVEPGETIEEAARREIGEEAGVHQLVFVAPLCMKKRFVPSHNEEKELHYFLFTTEQKELSPTATDKPHRAKWVDLFSCGDISAFEEQNEVLELARRHVLTNGLNYA